MGNDAVNNTSNSTVGDNILRPASIRLLYEGMVIHDDIYDSSKDRLLMTGGGKLTSDIIERMYRVNGNSDTIYVTNRTHKTMLSKRPDIDIVKRADLEGTTGYAVMLSKIRSLFQRITESKKVSLDGFNDLANKVADFINNAPLETVISLVNSITPKEEYIERHIVNVGILGGLQGRWLGLSDEEVYKLISCGLLHDCGLALMPMEILHAPRKFTRLDYEVVKMHAIHTEELLSDFPQDIRMAAAAHHERIDGSGYPKNSKGDALDGATRITAVSDIYEAIVSTRAHRPPRSPFFALALLDEMSPEQIDKDVVRTLKEFLPKELIGKPATMSDGTIGMIREIDAGDIEYPMVEISKKLVKTNRNLYCVSMYLDE